MGDSNEKLGTVSEAACELSVTMAKAKVAMTAILEKSFDAKAQQGR